MQENTGISPQAEEGRMPQGELSTKTPDDVPGTPQGGVKEHHNNQMKNEGVLDNLG
jgi:hypothetical protein